MHLVSMINTVLKYSGMSINSTLTMKHNIMKNISYLLTCLCFGLLIVGCRDDERIHIPEVQTGVNLRIVLDPANRNIDGPGDKIAMDLYSQNDDLSLVEIFVHYNAASHLVATYTQADFADGVEHLEFTAEDLASWFGVPGFADATAGGDFFIRPRVTLTDGRVYPDYVNVSPTDSILNLSGSVQSSANGAFTIRAPFSILCVALDLTGDFNVVTTGQSVWAGTPCNSVFTGRVRWVLDGPATYNVFTEINGTFLDDMSMGGYTACYGVTTEGGLPNGAMGESGTLRIKENCGKLTIIGSSQWGEAYTIDDLSVNGNVLTINWSNTYGESAISVLTRTDGTNWPAHLSN